MASETTWAQSSATFPNTRILIGIPQYSGLDGTSFGETGSGTSAELQVEVEGAWVAPFGAARAMYVSGTQNFLDGTSNRESSFSFMQGGFDLGLRLFPLKRRKSGFNIYCGASFGINYQSLQLDESLTTTSIPKSDQSLSNSFAGFVGAELILGGTSKKKWTLIAEMAQRTEYAKILNQDRFDLRNSTISIGLGW